MRKSFFKRFQDRYEVQVLSVNTQFFIFELYTLVGTIVHRMLDEKILFKRCLDRYEVTVNAQSFSRIFYFTRYNLD